MRIIASIIFIFGFTGPVFAQDIPIILLGNLVQPSPLSATVVLDKSPTPEVKGVPRLMVVDIPLVSGRRTVDLKRIRDGNINAGTALSPWEKEVNFLSVTPEFSYLSKNINSSISGGIAGTNHEGILRRVSFIDASFESSLWFFLSGIDGFTEKEKISGALTGFQFPYHFSRLSAGSRGWLGVKIGGFSSNFISVKFGRGYVRTQGDNTFVSPTISELEPVLLYGEEFLTELIAAEGKLSYRRVTIGLLAENNSYFRVIYSPDPSRFGHNDFRDLKIEGTLELIPFLEKDFLRILVRGTGYSGDRDSLLFRNQQPSFQVFLRIRFK